MALKIFSHSGHIGNVLYSLPCIKILSGDEGAIIYLKEVFEDHRGHINGNCGAEGENYTQFMALKDLLLLQPYIREVIKYVPPPGYDYSPGMWRGIKMDYDLDRSRGQNKRRYIFHVQRYFDAFGITEDWRNHIPWLTIDNKGYRFILDENAPAGIREEKYAIFHITDRWHGFLPDWTKIYRQELCKYDHIYFTGYRHDYEKFESRYSTMMDYLPTDTLLDLARVVRDSQAVYTNQNCCLVICQALGKRYYLARNADRTHCHTGLLNETLI